MAADLYQVILMARDVDAVVKFYRDVLGLAVTYPAGEAGFTGQPWVTLDAGSATLAIHETSELRDKGAVQLSVRMDDVNAVYEALKSKGVDIEPPRPVGPNVVSAKARDPEGNVVSLEQVGVPAEASV